MSVSAVNLMHFKYNTFKILNHVNEDLLPYIKLIGIFIFRRNFTASGVKLKRTME